MLALPHLVCEAFMVECRVQVATNAVQSGIGGAQIRRIEKMNTLIAVLMDNISIVQIGDLHFG